MKKVFSTSMINTLLIVLVMISELIIPNSVFAQSPPPPGPGGGNPDDPLAVPFDSNMTLLLLLISIAFAIKTYKIIQKKKLGLL